MTKSVDEYLTTKEVADLLRKSVRTIWRWVKMGRLRPKRITRDAQPLFKRADVEQALEESECEQQPRRDDPSLG